VSSNDTGLRLDLKTEILIDGPWSDPANWTTSTVRPAPSRATY
jgi:hypothetical protein